MDHVPASTTARLSTPTSRPHEPRDCVGHQSQRRSGPGDRVGRGGGSSRRSPAYAAWRRHRAARDEPGCSASDEPGGPGVGPRATAGPASAVTLLEALAVFVAGIGAGTINTIVGSGTLITFPTLLAVGFPPVLGQRLQHGRPGAGERLGSTGIPPGAHRSARAADPAGYCVGARRCHRCPACC